jgi:hypothetical protein
MKKFYLLSGWASAVTGGIILVAVSTQWLANHDISLSTLRQDVTSHSAVTSFQTQPTSADDVTQYQAPGKVKGISTIIETQDARTEIVRQFLSRHNSPLEPHDHYAQVFVSLADKHGFDFRLLPAIAMQESNLCKKIPPGSYNCLGFGVHSRGTLGFESYEANFERAARELKSNYIDIGLTTPEEIMTKYTPSSNGSWANSVNQWMAEMKYNDRDQGREMKTNHSVFEYVSESTSSGQLTFRNE